AISQYGLQIAVGSEDGSIRRWDALSGAAIGGPMLGHTDGVESLAYSHGSSRARIVSGSTDNTIRVWDAGTGESVGTPIEGHQGWVLAVAFSQGGSCIASGSQDKTIRLWNSVSGAQLTTLVGHEDWVRAVCFVPGGEKLLSGSWSIRDRTLCVWNITTRQLLHRLPGFSPASRSMTVSPCGRYAAARSYFTDYSLHVLDIEAGCSVGTSLTGHTETVTSIAFSPDGTHIISGSFDGFVRIWD
ncbi:WD40 repeat-like protein, partial [Auricularia subglabra TFB-10046 SS5]